MIKSSQAGFYDLNVKESCFREAARKNTLETLFNLGYRTIAVNQIIDVVDSNAEIKKKKKKGEPRDNIDLVPIPFNVQELKDAALELGFLKMTFLNRLTLVFSSQDTLQKFIKSNNFKKYDLIGVIPTTLQALMFVCSNLDADILSFDPENKLNLRINRKMYFQLIDKGYHFELTYSPAIEDSTKRKNIIHLSHIYHTYGKSRNIIFSSGAENSLLIRSPYDVISLGFLFGLNDLQAKNAVLHFPRNVTVNAIGRRHGKAVMIVENIEHMDSAEPILIDSPSDEDMDTSEPAQKKSKQ